MEINKDTSLSKAIYYTKKFGFMSKAFYWECLTPPGQSTKYRYWEMFLDSNYFLPYRELRQSGEYFYLNLKALRGTDQSLEPVGKRTPLYFYHDEKIMRIMIALESAGLVARFWTEQELRIDRMLTFDLLGGDSAKLPDVVFDLKSQGTPFRSAIEIETTRKSNDRYYHGLLNYTALRRLDLLVYGVDQKRIADALKNELSRSFFNSLHKKSAFYSIPEFEQQGLESPLELNLQQISIGHFFKNLVEIRNQRFNVERENAEKKFS